MAQDLYDPITNSYIKKDDPEIMMDRIDRFAFREFFDMLNFLVDEELSDVEKYIRESGDYICDTVIELRKGNNSLKYSPYAMFVSSDNPEDTIEKFIKMARRYLFL